MARVINLSNVSSNNLVENGEYDAYIHSYREGKPSNGAKTKGADTFSLGFKIAEHESQAGRMVWDQYQIHPEGFWRIKALLAATGEYDEIELASETFEFDETNLAGRGLMVRIVVATRPAQGEYEAKNEIKRYKPAGALVAASAGF